MSSYHFLPWVRSGAAQFIDQPDTGSLGLKNRAALSADVSINGQPPVAELRRTLQLYGPGDVTGFDPREVIRTEPVHLSNDFEPNYFATIEFDRPDFPWMFTPVSAGNDSRLRPWICLIVIRKQAGVSVSYPVGSPLPVLEINFPADPAKELPDLSESWAWAHSQVTGDGPVESILVSEPERNLSRLICARRLEARQGYYACVVPTFEAGVQAGLGLPQAGLDLKPAWDLSSLVTPLKLPVYYKWEFMAGAAGDFEALVWALQRRILPEGIGVRTLEIVPPDPGWITDGQPAQVSLGGALRPVLTPGQPRPAMVGTDAAFLEKLLGLLNQGMDTKAWNLPEGMPVPPPAYGRWHAAQKNIPPQASQVGPANRAWLSDLNLEARNRAAAGLGVSVVQENQEHFMASAWEQLGEVEKANQILRQAQLAREASFKIYNHLVSLSEGELACLAGPVLTRVIRDGQDSQPTAYAWVSASKLPVAAVQGTFRRLTRPRGPLAKRLGSKHAGLLTARLVKGLASGKIVPVPPHPKPNGMVTDEDYGLKFDRPAEADMPLMLCSLTPDVLLQDRLLRNRNAGQEADWYSVFQATAARVQLFLPACGKAFVSPEPLPLPLNELRETLLKALDPRVTVQRRVQARLRLPSRWRPVDPLEPVMAAPVFPQAMYQDLAKVSQDFMLPRIEKIPPNTIALFETNPEFIEAFLAGMNWEMARELLWRGYPTDQRGSYFRQFWDPSGSLEQPDIRHGIKAMDQWESASRLGGNSLAGSGGGVAVLLIRGDLLRRYPNAMIYAHKAAWEDDGNGGQVRRPVPVPLDIEPHLDNFPEKYPIFQGKLPPDITFLGFPITSSDLLGDSAGEADAGYFIVLQQQPTEPRFGLDESQQENLGSWNSLSWDNVVLTDGKHIKLAGGLHMAGDLTSPFPQPSTEPDKDVFWFGGANSAHLAFITMQKPLRVMVHATDLIGS